MKNFHSPRNASLNEGRHRHYQFLAIYFIISWAPHLICSLGMNILALVPPIYRAGDWASSSAALARPNCTSIALRPFTFISVPSIDLLHLACLMVTSQPINHRLNVFTFYCINPPFLIYFLFPPQFHASWMPVLRPKEPRPS